MTYNDDDDDGLCDFIEDDNFFSNEEGVDNSGEEEPRGGFIDEDGYDIPTPYDLNLKGEKLSIVEEGKKEHVDFLIALYKNNGREKFQELFPRTKEDEIRTRNDDVFLMVTQYCMTLRESDYELKVHYYRSKRTPRTGRWYAHGKRGYGGQQRLPREVRKFIQSGIYYDYDIVSAWPSLLYKICAGIRGPLLKAYITKCHDGTRETFLEENKITKHGFNCLMNIDEPR